MEWVLWATVGVLAVDSVALLLLVSRIKSLQAEVRELEFALQPPIDLKQTAHGVESWRNNVL